jgi:hypothetical protein
VYDTDVFEMEWTRWELSYPDVVWNGTKGLTLDLYSYAPVHEFNSQDNRIYTRRMPGGTFRANIVGREKL